MTNREPDDYWASLPAATQMKLRTIAWKYLRQPTIPNETTARQLMYWQEVHLEVLEAHTEWLSATKAAVEALGRPWTTDEMNRYLEETGQ